MTYEAQCDRCGGVTEHRLGICLTCEPEQPVHDNEWSSPALGQAVEERGIE